MQDHTSDSVPVQGPAGEFVALMSRTGAPFAFAFIPTGRPKECACSGKDCGDYLLVAHRGMNVSPHLIAHVAAAAHEAIDQMLRDAIVAHASRN